MVSLIALLVGGVFLVIGLTQIARASSELRTVYHILSNDPIPIRDLPSRSGPVEIEGTAAVDDDHDPVRSIFTESQCLAYDYEVEEYRSSGKNSSWHTLDSGSEAVPFVVEDDTGAVRVSPDNAEFRFEDHTLRIEGGQEPPERIRAYIERTDAVDPQDKSLDVVVTELDYGNDQRFTERRLDPGEDVYVYGTVGSGPGGEWGSRLVDAVIEDGPGIPEFVVSDTTERATARRIGKSAAVKAATGLLFGGFGAVALVLTLT